MTEFETSFAASHWCRVWRRVNPMSRPAPAFAINDHITHKQHALSERNELSDHNELAKLKVTTHVDEVLASCAGSLYALRVLRAHGLDEHSLRTVCKATTLNRILYAG